MRSSWSSRSASISARLGVEGGDPLARRDGRCLEVGDLRTVGLCAALDGLADALRGGVSLGLERLALAEEPAPFAVELEGAIDQRRVLALVDGTLADDVRLVAESLQADAHG